MSKYKIIFKETFYYSVSKAIPGFFGFLSVILFMRFFGSKEYGQYSLILAQCNLIAALSFGWLNQAQLRYFSKDKKTNNYKNDQINFLFYSGLFASLILSFLCIIFNYSLLIWFMSIFGIISIGVFNYLRTFYQVKLLPKKIIRLNMLQSFLAIILPIICLIITKNYKGILFGVTLSFFLVATIFIISESNFKFNFINNFGIIKNKILIKKWFNYGAPLSIWFAAGLLLSFLDRFFINYFLTKEALGMYSSLHELLVKSFSLTLFPFTMALHPRIINLWNESKRKEASNLIINGILIMLLIGLILILVFWKFNNYIFTLIQLAIPEFSNEYKGLIFPLFLTGFLWQLSFLTHKLLELKEKTLLMVISIIPSIIINIFINYNYLSNIGIIVSAYTAFFSALVYCVLTSAHCFINIRKI